MKKNHLEKEDIENEITKEAEGRKLQGKKRMEKINRDLPSGHFSI